MRSPQPQSPDEDEEDGEISNDPLLSAVAADLERVTKRTDNGLLLALFGFWVPVAFIYERSAIKSLWMSALLVIGIFATIAFTIFRVVQKKTDVAAKYGLVCRSCGYKPPASQVLAVAQSLRCSKCRGQLFPKLP